MNAVFARNAAGLFPGFERYVRRYEREGFGDVAGRLLRYLDGADEGHVSDIRTVDAWAGELELTELYEWRSKGEYSSPSTSAFAARRVNEKLEMSYHIAEFGD
jgi:hypothetical protein